MRKNISFVSILQVLLLLAVLIIFLRTIRKESFTSYPIKPFIDPLSQYSFEKDVEEAEEKRLKRILSDHEDLLDKSDDRYREFTKKYLDTTRSQSRRDFKEMGSALQLIKSRDLPQPSLSEKEKSHDVIPFDEDWDVPGDATVPTKTLIPPDYKTFRGFTVGRP